MKRFIHSPDSEMLWHQSEIQLLLMKNINNFGGDSSLIFISGHSAGGYLASMVGIDKRWLEKHDIDADNIAGLIPFSGHTITHFTVRKERGIPGEQPIIDDLAPLYNAAREHKVTIVCGIVERDGQLSQTTLYNTIITIGPDGTLLNKHRKLMPTNPERMVWGQGDGSGLRVVDTPVGRIGGLICWENYMPLARYTLYAQSIDIFLSPTWDNGDSWQATMRHIATEGGCWVLSCATAMQGSDVPDDFPYKDELFPDPDEWVNDGGAVVMKPFTGAIAGPMNREKATLYAEIDISAAHDARRSLDVTGHYSRPDVFDLHVDRSHRDPATFED